MEVTKAELRDMADRNDTWKDGKGDHPTLFISDDLFDRILDDLHELAKIESGQGELELGAVSIPAQGNGGEK